MATLKDKTTAEIVEVEVPKVEVVDEKKVEEPDDGFTDEKTANPPEIKPEEKIEEAPKQDAVEEKKGKEEKPVEPASYTYESKNLEAIEGARKGFFANYKKNNRYKTFVSVAVLLVIVAGWIVPSTIPALNGTTAALVISLCVVGVAIVGLGIYSYFFRKKSDQGIKVYFAKYYDFMYAYTFETIAVKGFHGDLDSKLDQKEFTDCGMYDDVFKVGSRYGVTFTYKDMDCAIVDCASQNKGKKALETTFVGKYLRAPNTYDGTGIVIYFKGNDRALPPNGLKRMELIEENTSYSVYGAASEKKYLTHAIRQALAQIETNKTLVDVAISIKPGRTYFCLGYEDTLMVIPLQKSFDPAPVVEFRKNIGLFLDLATLFNQK